MTELRHVLTSEMFDRELLDKLFISAESMRRRLETDRGEAELTQLMAGVRCMLFFEETSTRTHGSFREAADNLGMRVHEFRDPRISSMYKGEALLHSIRVMIGIHRPRILVARLAQKGMVGRTVELCEEYSNGKRPIWVINAGDGDGEHPTQSLVDTYTIWRKFGTLNNLTIVLSGDLLMGRTVHSLVRLMTLFEGNRFILVSPEECALPDDLKALMDERGAPYQETHEIKDALREADVAYQTRVQLERFKGEMAERLIEAAKKCQIGREELACLRKDAILLHPLPIDQKQCEITNDISDHAVAPLERRVGEFQKFWCFDQSDNGPVIRMALFDWGWSNMKE